MCASNGANLLFPSADCFKGTAVAAPMVVVHTVICYNAAYVAHLISTIDEMSIDAAAAVAAVDQVLLLLMTIACNIQAWPYLVLVLPARLGNMLRLQGHERPTDD
jgi:hypothetical protein